MCNGRGDRCARWVENNNDIRPWHWPCALRVLPTAVGPQHSRSTRAVANNAVIPLCGRKVPICGVIGEVTVPSRNEGCRLLRAATTFDPIYASPNLSGLDRSTC